MSKVASYTAASTIPVKLLTQPVIVDGKIVPYHVQINPTNRCNLNCEFCSCSARDKTLEMPTSELLEMLEMFRSLGMKAVTITGGGEPLLHPGMSEVIRWLTRHDVEAGLVTNGIEIERLAICPKWIRVSVSDDRELDGRFFDPLRAAIAKLPGAGWALSYVLTSSPDWDKLRRCVEFAGQVGMTHVRIVSDLLDLENVPPMTMAATLLQGHPGEELVIYQGRKDHARGTHECWISLVKPLVGADGMIYPCCGVQYALSEPGRDYEPSMRMCHWTEFPEVFATQRHFDGSNCLRCYYRSYNVTLGAMRSPLEHGVFV